MDREGEYCAALLCVGGPPDLRPPRDLLSGNVDHAELDTPARATYSTWATKIRELAVAEEWIPNSYELFEWITGFLEWYDSLEERYHA